MALIINKQGYKFDWSIFETDSDSAHVQIRSSCASLSLVHKILVQLVKI